MRQRVTLAATLILAAIFVAPLIARATGGKSPRSTPLAALAPLAAVVAVAATTVAISVTWWLAMLIAIPTALLVYWQLPPRRCRSQKRGQESRPVSADMDAVVLRFLSLNAYVGRADPEAVIRAVRRLSPDVFVIQEITPQLTDSLANAGLSDLLPFSCLEPRPGSRGFGLWSRFPVSELPIEQGGRKVMLRAQLYLGWPVTVTVVHLASPVGGRQPAWQHDMEWLLRNLIEVAGQHLVAGDFNASRDHGAFRRLLAAQFEDSADTAAHRRWPGFTWPANRKMPAIMRLDHILVSEPGAPVRDSRTFEIAGSDHRAVYAVIELHPVRSREQGSATAATAGRRSTGGPEAVTSGSGSPDQDSGARRPQ